VKPTVNVLYLPGTNCQVETLRAFRDAGAAPRLVFVSDALAGTARLDDADILCLPGGFSFGDHVAAGAAAGLLLATRLRDQFLACRDRLILCICNGFQTAVRAGCFGSGVTLTVNSSGTFRDVPNQPHEVVNAAGSPWLAGLEALVLRFPCAHGEGRFEYTNSEQWRPALRYPVGENPDGSVDGIAGITTTDGLVLGLMNHPERAADRDVRLAIFRNGVQAART
jgi:phosphoribosylformylglycinamidine synthase